jgi:hypothetical protein
MFNIKKLPNLNQILILTQRKRTTKKIENVNILIISYEFKYTNATTKSFPENNIEFLVYNKKFLI